MRRIHQIIILSLIFTFLTPGRISPLPVGREWSAGTAGAQSGQPQNPDPNLLASPSRHLPPQETPNDRSPSLPELQFRDHHLLSTEHRSLFTDYRSPFTDHRSPFTDHRSLFTVDRSPFTEPRSPFTDSSLFCTYVTEHAALVDGVTAQTWSGWISKLSGAEEVTVNKEPTYLTTRNSYALFNGTSPAFDYLRETLLAWYPPEQVEEDPYTYNGYTWKNMVLTIPGTAIPEEVVILSAHFDDMPSIGIAPGADDNASGSAALLEAARILQGQSFPRTIRLVWFTGEEQGMIGSRAYTLDHDLSSTVGAINLDMYAYDLDNDRCFELHVGTLPESQPVGRCFRDTIDAYGLDLNYDYLTTQGATNSSDHSSFWSHGVGAVEVLENYYSNGQTGGCTGLDRNPNYHHSTDTLAQINLSTGLAITKAALAAALSMADPQPLPPVFYLPWISVE